MDIKQIVLDLCALSDEQEWFEFKENWFQPEALGEYVSALSNAAAFHYKKYAYFIWGVNDKTHEIVGTTFNQYCEYNKEPYQNYLARNLSPSINFSFEETEIYGKRVVGLVIPAATEIPTAFKEKRFLRIGSSKCNMKDYPKREIELFKILDGRTETIETVPAKYQDLTFQKLFGYYGSKGIVLNQKTFIKNLGLKTGEAIINAVLHNKWVEGNEPMISVFSDRIEILSRGTLAPAQTMEGFFLGESIPVNEKLSEIFLQLHISEKSGRGVPKITEMYGKDAFSFRENSIVVTIPFERINKVGNKVGKKVGDKKPLNSRRQKIIAEMRDNPNITTAELHNILGVSETAVENNISFLRENGYIERVGSKKAGYWKVL